MASSGGAAGASAGECLASNASGRQTGACPMLRTDDAPPDLEVDGSHSGAPWPRPWESEPEAAVGAACDTVPGTHRSSDAGAGDRDCTKASEAEAASVLRLGRWAGESSFGRGVCVDP